MKAWVLKCCQWGAWGDAIAPPEDAADSFNIFTFNLAVSLGVTDEPERLAGVQLSDFLLDIVQDGEEFRYVGGHEIGDGETAVPPDQEAPPPHLKRRVLIIDQFEEIFTVHPERERERIRFFKQVTDAMTQDPYLYVLFSMRGDYIDRLSPYVKYLPDSLRTRYYMERMRERAALDAVRLPAKKAGRPFETDVAQKLVQYLRGSDLYVETVQLQVVCLQLWQSLANIEGDTITMDNVVEVAANLTTREPDNDADEQETADPLALFIDNAMASYYQQAIKAVLRHPDAAVPEHVLRNWFSKELITAAGTRDLLARGETETEGIPEVIIDLLDREHYLVRNDMRGGRPFIELVHDSFVEPILRANRRWEANRTRNITWLPAALRYHKTQDATLLLKGDQLTAAQSQAAAILGLPPEATSFLEASTTQWQQEKEALQQHEMERQQALIDSETQRANDAVAAKTRQRWLLVLAGIIGAVAIIFAIRSQSATRQAEEQTALALSEGTRAAEEAATAAAAQAEVISINATRDAEALAAAEEERLRLNLAFQSVELANNAEAFLSRNNLYGALLLAHMATEISEEGKAHGVMLQALYEATNRNIQSANPDTDNAFEEEQLLANLAFDRSQSFLTGPQTGTLAAITDEGVVWWNLEGSELVRRAIRLGRPNIDVATFSIRTQTTLLAIAENSTLTLLEQKNDEWEERARWDAETGTFEQIAFNPAGNQLAAALCDAESCFIHNWQIEDNQLGEHDSRAIGRQEEILGLVFVGEDVVWNSQTEVDYYSLTEDDTKPPVLPQPPDIQKEGYRLQTLVFIEPHNWLIVGGSCENEQCGFVRWWSLELGGWLTPSLEQPASVQQLLYEQTSSSLIAVLSTSSGPSLLAWETRPAIWQEIACDLVGRNLTYAEWQEALPGQEIEAYPRICSDVLHSSVINRLVDEAEQTLNNCNESETANARTQYQAARPEENFETWAVPILLETALREIRDDCMEQVTMLVPDLEFDDEAFSQQRDYVLKNNDDFNYDFYLERRQAVLFEQAIALLDQYVAQKIYQTPCFTENNEETAKVACEHYYELLDQSGLVESFVWIEPTERSDDTHEWIFDIASPEFVAINFSTQDDEPYPLLTIHNELDDKIASSEGNDAGELDSLLPEPGKYIIRVHWETIPSNYTLSVETLTPNLIEANAIGPGEANQQLWQFEAFVGSFANIQLTASEAGSAPYLYLYDPNGRDVGQYQDTPETSTAQSFLSEGGLYTVVVRWGNSPSSYELSVETTSAMPIEVGHAAVSAEPTQRVWQFEAIPGNLATISLNAIGLDTFPVIEVYDSDYNFISSASGFDAASLITVLPKGGLYTIMVRWDSEPSSYTLSVETTPPNTIEVGSAGVRAESDQRVWQFEAAQGDLVSISLNAMELDTFPFIELYDPEGSLIEFSSGYETLSLETFLAKPGIYTIMVNWDSEPSPYTLSVETTLPTTVVIGEDSTAEVTAEPDEKVWQFVGTPENLATISLNTTELDAFPFITLYDPDGNPIGYGSGYETAFLESFLLKDGLYTFVVGWDSASSSYTLAVTIEPITPQQIPDDDFSQEADEQQWWQFEGEAGTQVVITMEALEEDGDPYLWLYDENFDEIASNDDFEGLNSQIEIVLPEDGVYYIQADWYDNPGRYRLTITR